MAPRELVFSALARTFYSQFTERDRREGLQCGPIAWPGTPSPVLQWLISDCRLLGLPGQNWMWVLPAGLLIYFAALVVLRRRQSDIR